MNIIWGLSNSFSVNGLILGSGEYVLLNIAINKARVIDILSLYVRFLKIVVENHVSGIKNNTQQTRVDR